MSNIRLVATMPAATLVCLTLSSYFGWKTCLLSLKAINDEPMSPSRNRNAIRSRKNILWLMGLNITCAVGIELALLIIFAWFIAIAIVADRKSEWDNFSPIYNDPLIYHMFIVFEIIQGLSYVMLIVTCFERLKLSFINSKYRLSDTTIRLAYGSVCIFFLFLLASSVSYEFSLLISAVMTIPCIISYISLSLYTSIKFYTCTVEIAHNLNALDSDNETVQSRSDNDNLESTRDKSKSLLQTSIRLTLCTGISTFSTLLTLAFFALGITVSNLFQWMFIVSLPFDLLINQVCLALFFQDNMDIYLAILGGLHRRWEQYLIGGE